MLVLQGSRRSGRTTVATSTALGAALSGLQTLLVCPSQGLAQHAYDTIKKSARKSYVVDSPAKGTIEFRGASIKVAYGGGLVETVRGQSYDLIIADCVYLTDDQKAALNASSKQVLYIPDSDDTSGAS